jgi:hypothetical protein
MNNQTRRSYLEEAGLHIARVYPDALSVTKDHKGAWLVSAVFEGYRHAISYMGYTQEEAIAEYLDTYNKKGN